MTEEEWLTCADPQRMLAFLRGKVSERKSRLYACGCCRRVWHRLPGPRSRSAIEIAERFADSNAKVLDLQRAQVGARDENDPEASPDENPAIWATADSAYAGATEAAVWALAIVAARARVGCRRQHVAAERQGQSDLARDIFSPFGRSRIDPSWLFWNEGFPHRLSAEVYAERSFTRMPILADALEDAGCTDAAILSHLRSPGPHVRGCWALDLILGKE